VPPDCRVDVDVDVDGDREPINAHGAGWTHLTVSEPHLQRRQTERDDRRR
jgi:hypothetical protein